MAQYKEISAYILILPGLGLKFFADIWSWVSYGKAPAWLKLKLAMMVFLTVNAFVFLTPMMPELKLLAEQSIPAGVMSEAFLEKATLEQYIGMSNIIPLITEIVVGSFKPKLWDKNQP